METLAPETMISGGYQVGYRFNGYQCYIALPNVEIAPDPC